MIKTIIQANKDQFNTLLNVGYIHIEGLEVSIGEPCELHCEGNVPVNGICAFYWKRNNNHIAIVLSEEYYQHFMNQGTIICTKCGSHDVECEAMVNPNSKSIEHYTDESFDYGWCNKCSSGTILTDTKDVKNDIKEKYQEFIDKNKQEPQWAWCEVTMKDVDNEVNKVKIKLSCDIEEENSYLYYCNGLNNLLSLCEFGIADFTITNCFHFGYDIVKTNKVTISKI